MTIPLRGLSFSEGPSITTKVRVSAGGAQAVAEVDNSLVDAHASDAASVITTDGAGQASVDVTVVGACEGKAAGEVVNVPVTVATDFATVVEASDGLTIPRDLCRYVGTRPEPLGRCCGWFPVWHPGASSDAAQEREGSQELPGSHGRRHGGPGRSTVCRSDRWCRAGRPSPRQSLPKREQVALDRRGGGARHSDQT